MLAYSRAKRSYHVLNGLSTHGAQGNRLVFTNGRRARKTHAHVTAGVQYAVHLVFQAHGTLARVRLFRRGGGGARGNSGAGCLDIQGVQARGVANAQAGHGDLHGRRTRGIGITSANFSYTAAYIAYYYSYIAAYSYSYCNSSVYYINGSKIIRISTGVSSRNSSRRSSRSRSRSRRGTSRC